ncbi:hypothetical protein NDU88_010077 [Pleurodeles waltl]|uniref:Uncharacterized protein n=1 Tax=Pleurodeles waltl TaxID=8319 RepID=A0AAV7RX39_PLEWA|nr:hypothetical protein NDU88_010077 [Pleurodeles waltl]
MSGSTIDFCNFRNGMGFASLLGVDVRYDAAPVVQLYPQAVTAPEQDGGCIEKLKQAADRNGAWALMAPAGYPVYRGMAVARPAALVVIAGGPRDGIAYDSGGFPAAMG